LILKSLDSVRVEHKFEILSRLPANVVMGLDIRKKLRLRVMLDGKAVFKRFEEMRGSCVIPTVILVKGINFVERSDKEISKVTRVSVKPIEAVFVWSGWCCLYRNHVAEIASAI
jgi:hypothetical protein